MARDGNIFKFEGWFVEKFDDAHLKFYRTDNGQSSGKEIEQVMLGKKEFINLVNFANDVLDLKPKGKKRVSKKKSAPKKKSAHDGSKVSSGGSKKVIPASLDINSSGNKK